MIIAVPLSRNRLARHFTKAKEIAFFDQQLNLLERMENPAIEGNCAAKKAMLNLIKDKGSTLVMVDQIGERMLGKLLALNLQVSRADTGLELENLFADKSNFERYILSAEEGRPSNNHAKKGGCGGGCGCGGHSHEHDDARLLSKPTANAELSFSGFTKC